MVFLWVFGDDVERALGRVRYLAFYLLCGAIGGLVFVANDPHSAIELIGASGAIAGVVVGYVMLRPCARITVLLTIIPLRISAFWVVGLFVISQLWSLGASSKSEVAYWCHFGGLLAGAVLFPVLKPRAVKLLMPAAGAGYGGADRPQPRRPCDEADRPPLTLQGSGH